MHLQRILNAVGPIVVVSLYLPNIHATQENCMNSRAGNEANDKVAAISSGHEFVRTIEVLFFVLAVRTRTSMSSWDSVI